MQSMIGLTVVNLAGALVFAPAGRLTADHALRDRGGIG